MSIQILNAYLQDIDIKDILDVCLNNVESIFTHI